MEPSSTPPGELDSRICDEVSRALERRRHQQFHWHVQGRARTHDVESDHFTVANYFSRTDVASSSSSETDTSSEEEKIIEEFALRYPPQQKLSFLSGARSTLTRRKRQSSIQSVTHPGQPKQHQPCVNHLPATHASSSTHPPQTAPPANPAQVIHPSCVTNNGSHVGPASRPPLPQLKAKRRPVRRSVAAHRRSCLLRCLKHYRSECMQAEALNAPQDAAPSMTLDELPTSFPATSDSLSGLPPIKISPARLVAKESVSLGPFWAEILPVVVSGFLDLKSVVRLRQCCKRLYFKRRYSLASCSFEQSSALTEQELVTKVLPSLKAFLTAGSLSQLNFSRCCLLTDSFPKSIMSLYGGKLRRHLRAFFFDFCYAMTDKFLETLLLMHLPNLETLSLRCARSRDLTGAPFSQKDLLNKERWPKFHQFSCSCTQMALPHLDAVALFVAERAVELSVSPKLGIAGSLASNSLIRRLGLELEHQKFIESIVLDGTVEAVEAAIATFEKQWLKAVDEGEHKSKVLHRLLRNRSVPLLINAPCSVAVVDDGQGHEKAMWLLMGSRRRSTTLTTKKREGTTRGPVDGERLVIPEICCSCRYEIPGLGISVLDETPTPIRTASSHPQKATLRTSNSGVTEESTSACVYGSSDIEIKSKGSTGRPTAPSSLVTTPSSIGASLEEKASAIETDVVSHVQDEFENKQVNYSRWSYPLPMAIRLGNLPVVSLLLQKGAHVDVWGYTFATPLYIAVANAKSANSSPPPPLQKYGSGDSLSLGSTGRILEEIVNVEESSDPDSPITAPPGTTTATTKVIPNAQSPGAVSVTSGAPAASLCKCQCHQKNVCNDVEECNNRRTIVYLLLKWGAPVDAPDLYSIKCPVNAAIKNDNQSMLETLITAGAKINVRALPQGVIPPLITMSRRQQEKKQLKGGLTRLSFKSPLFLASELNAKSCIEVLLDAGADPHWRDPFSNRNVTPTLLAYRKEPELLQLFVNKGAGSSPSTRWILSEVLAAAILQQDVPSVTFLVKKYPDLLERESSGMWSLPLIQAARLNKVNVLQTFLQLGADPNAINSQGLTSLHLAASEGHKSAIECLLKYKAKPNIVGGSNQKTPLHIAVEENRKDVVEVLLNYDADITVKDASGLTPLMTAIASRNDKVAMLLIQRGTKEQLDVLDSSNRTALMYGIYFGQFKVADALVEKGVSVKAQGNTGFSAEDLLKQKVQSLGRSGSTSTINKILRNIVGAGGPPGSAASKSKSVDIESLGGSDHGQGGSEESVRKLNAKRKKVARRLLKKIRAKAKKDLSAVVPTSLIPSSEGMESKQQKVNEVKLLEPNKYQQQQQQQQQLDAQLITTTNTPLYTPLPQQQQQQQSVMKDSSSSTNLQSAKDIAAPKNTDVFIPKNNNNLSKDFNILQQKSSEIPSLDCHWGVSSAGGDDDLSSPSSDESDSSTESEK